MKDKLDKLLNYAAKKKATDIHFSRRRNKLEVTVRGIDGISVIKDKDIDIYLFNYLKYIANLDLGSSSLPQSGNFTIRYHNNNLYFRFAYMKSNDAESGVLRILNNHEKINIDELSKIKKQNEQFKKWCMLRSGLIIFSGPTGSGKSTSLHAMLEYIAMSNIYKIVTLEDPIEIESENYLQFQINERINFSYEEGIKQILRHDPDVIMIGEVRDEVSAKMLVRAALSGHMVFTTIHAKSCKEAIKRLVNFGIDENDLKDTLTGLTNQRIFISKREKNKRLCVYEIMDATDIINTIERKKIIHDDINDEIKRAYQKGWISKEEAGHDISL